MNNQKRIEYLERIGARERESYKRLSTALEKAILSEAVRGCTDVIELYMARVEYHDPDGSGMDENDQLVTLYDSTGKQKAQYQVGAFFIRGEHVCMNDEHNTTIETGLEDGMYAYIDNDSSMRTVTFAPYLVEVRGE